MTEAPQQPQTPPPAEAQTQTKPPQAQPPPLAQAQAKCRICLKPFSGFPLGEKNGYTFEACKVCGSVTTIPWPTQADLDKFFGDLQPEMVHMPNPQGEISHTKRLLKKL